MGEQILTVGDLLKGTGARFAFGQQVSGLRFPSASDLVKATDISGRLDQAYADNRPPPLIHPQWKHWSQVDSATRARLMELDQRAVVVEEQGLYYCIPLDVMEGHQSVVAYLGALGDVSITYCALCDSAIVFRGKWAASSLFYRGNRVFFNQSDPQVFVTQMEGIPFRIASNQVVLNTADPLPPRFGAMIVNWKNLVDTLQRSGAYERVRFVLASRDNPLKPTDRQALEAYRSDANSVPAGVKLAASNVPLAGNAKDRLFVAVLRPVGFRQQVYVTDQSQLSDQVCCHPLPNPFEDFIISNSILLHVMYLTKGEGSRSPWQSFDSPAPVAFSTYRWAAQQHFPLAANLEPYTKDSVLSFSKYHCHTIDRVAHPDACHGLDCALTPVGQLKAQALSAGPQLERIREIVRRSPVLPQSPPPRPSSSFAAPRLSPRPSSSYVPPRLSPRPSSSDVPPRLSPRPSSSFVPPSPSTANMPRVSPRLMTPSQSAALFHSQTNRVSPLRASLASGSRPTPVPTTTAYVPSISLPVQSSARASSPFVRTSRTPTFSPSSLPPPAPLRRSQFSAVPSGPPPPRESSRFSAVPSGPPPPRNVTFAPQPTEQSIRTSPSFSRTPSTSASSLRSSPSRFSAAPSGPPPPRESSSRFSAAPSPTTRSAPLSTAETYPPKFPPPPRPNPILPAPERLPRSSFNPRGSPSYVITSPSGRRIPVYPSPSQSAADEISDDLTRVLSRTE